MENSLKQIVKLNLLLKLYYDNNLTADNFKELVKKYDISKDVERCGIERNKNIVKQINFDWDFHGSNGFENNNIARFGKLLKILFMVTNGNKQCLDNLSKVVAGIILGPTVCKKFDLNIKIEIYIDKDLANLHGLFLI